MRFSVVFIIFASLLLGGCNGNGNNSNKNANGNANRVETFNPPAPIKPLEAVDPAFKTCNPYFPLVPGSVARYVINYSSGIVGDMTVIVDAAEENGRKVFTQRSQLVDRSGGMQISQLVVRKFVCDGDRVIILSETTEGAVAGQRSSVDFDYRENSVMMESPQVLSRKGSTWTHAFRNVLHSPGRPPAPSDVPTLINFVVGETEEVTTAAGKFKGVKITRNIGENYTIDYYVPGLGLARRVAREGTSWDLKEYSGLKALD